MKQSVTDVIRRGFENTIANWPLLLIKIAESVLLVILAIVAVLAIIIPIGVSLGIGSMTAGTPEEAVEFLLGTLAEKWMVIIYVLVVITVVLTVFVAVHSFVEAGAARIYVEGEAAAGPLPTTSRAQFKVFTAERWLAGAKRDWWPVFWIFNLAWAVASLILLLPLIVMVAFMFVARENPAAMAGITCLGLGIFVLVAIAVMTVTNIWCQKAIVVCVARTHTAVGALGEAWREFKADAGRHIGVALILFLLMIVGSGVFASISIVGGMSDAPTFAIAMLPLQLVGSFANTIFSTVIGAWFLACFATLAVDPR